MIVVEGCGGHEAEGHRFLEFDEESIGPDIRDDCGEDCRRILGELAFEKLE